MVKVSVISPIYNVARYLPAALDSVLAQTMRDWECVLVDDGSTDGSGAICDEYAARDARFRVIHQPNAGAGAARNSGIDVATGEYLFFMDPDDLLHPRGLERMVAAADRGRADVVVFPIIKYYCNDHRFEIAYRRRRHHSNGFPHKPFSGRSVAGIDFFWFFWFTVWDKLFRREFIVEKRIRYQSIRKYNDMAFALECGFKADRIVTMSFPAYLYFAGRAGSLQNSAISNELIWQVVAECERRIGGVYGGVWEPYLEEFFAGWKVQNSPASQMPGTGKAMSFKDRLHALRDWLWIRAHWPRISDMVAGR